MRLFVFGLVLPLWAGAQTPDSIARLEITAGSGAERTIIDRCAKRVGMPISVRPFGPRVMDSLLAMCGQNRERKPLVRAPTWGTLWVNTTRALTDNPGPVWVGRGATVAVSSGLAGHWRAISYSVRPIAFWSQNQNYAISRTVPEVPGDYRNPWVGGIDLPYRFGDRSYARVDPGESYVRIDSRWAAAGFSTAAQVWGPARVHPLVLGNNAGGFPSVFIETGTPRPVGIGRFATRWVAGLLESSPSARARPGYQARVGIGAVGTFVPRGMAGLELGGSRFFHLYDSHVARDFHSLTLPFSGLLKAGLGDVDTKDARQYNQLASFFARLAPPESHVEVYGEFYREDHSADLRDFLVEPDHISAFMVGLRRHWPNHQQEDPTSLTIELVNGRISHLNRVRPQSPPYTHSFLSEGHTLRGKSLASPALVGGGALVVLFERGTTRRGWHLSAEMTRLAQDKEAGSWNGSMSGSYTLGVGWRELLSGNPSSLDLRVQPGFGDVRGTNVMLAMSAFLPPN